MNEYVINATSALKNQTNENLISLVSYDLSLISEKIPQIKQIVLRGGAAVDIISGNQPNDFDLFYTYKTGDKLTKKCVCKSIRNKIKDLPFKCLKSKDIDLENSYEKEPRFNPIKRTVGQFSFHTEYNSQFAIDKDGQIWTNIDALKYHTNGIYEVCYENFLPWAYFPRKGDSQNYWSFQAYMLIRGIGYITTRNLTPGEKFMRMFNEYNRVIKSGLRATGLTGFQEYAKSKIKTHQNFISFLEKYIDKSTWGEIMLSFSKILEKCS